MHGLLQGREELVFPYLLETRGKAYSFSFFPNFFFPASCYPFPDAQDKLDGKQLAPEIWETGIVAVGSLVGKLCQQKLCGLQVGPLQPLTLGFLGHPPNSRGAQNISCPSPPSPPANPEQVVERGVETILRGLRGAEEEPKVVISLLALGNARLPETIPTLLEHAEDGPTAVTTAATSALQRFPAPHISSKVGEEVVRLGAPLPTPSQAAGVHLHSFNYPFSSGEASDEEDFPPEEEEL